VELTDRGYIKVNERLQTTAPGVWVIGEVAGSPQFTHISIDDFRVVHANLTGGNRVTTGRQVPSCLFTDPELARIGLSETEAEARGIAYRLFKVPMKTNLRAHTLSETRGFVKALVEADSDRILGFTAFAAGAGETMAVVQVAMIAGLPYMALRDAVLTHPTPVEGLISLFSSAASVSIIGRRCLDRVPPSGDHARQITRMNHLHRRPQSQFFDSLTEILQDSTVNGVSTSPVAVSPDGLGVSDKARFLFYDVSQLVLICLHIVKRSYGSFEGRTSRPHGPESWGIPAART